MNLHFSFYLFNILLLFNLACGSSAPESIQGVQIKGVIQGADQLQLFVDKSGLTKASEVIGKSLIQSDGSFEVEFAEKFDPGIYRIRIGAQQAYLPFTGKENMIEINGSLQDFGKYAFEIKGAESAIYYSALLKEFYRQDISKESLLSKIDQAPEPLAAMQLAFATQGGLNASTIALHKKISQQLANTYPGSAYSLDYATLIQQAEQQIAMQQASEIIKLGMPAPEIELPDPSGTIRRLSDLKGKVVLLDFWASWCGPCRRANPHVVEIYNKYKSQGFDVFSVSLDGINPRMLGNLDENQKDQQIANAKVKWVNAIEKDELNWENHVSDLQHWNSPVAKLYGVRGIPRTFIIDRNGNIANTGINPLRDDVEAAIKPLL